jgi:hypothetical protein
VAPTPTATAGAAEAEPETAGAGGREAASEGRTGSGREALAGWERRTEASAERAVPLAVGSGKVIAWEIVTAVTVTTASSPATVVLVVFASEVVAQGAAGLAERGARVLSAGRIEWVLHGGLLRCGSHLCGPRCR